MGEIIAFILYFVAMLGIGIFFFIASKNKGEKDYFLGGRQMGPWVTAMSAQASDMSAWLLMGLPGSILAFGLGKAWIGIGLAIGTILNWIFIAKRLRKFSLASGDAITFPQYLSNRFATTNPALKIICAIVFLISFTIYVASAFSAGAKVFIQLFPQLDLNPDPAVVDGSLAMGIFAIIILVYTFLGGYKAVCWTDFFQGLLMLAALLLVPIVIATTMQLDTNTLSQVFVVGDETYSFTTNLFGASWQDIVSGLAWGLGYFGMPHILVRFMAIKKPSMVKKSAVVACVWVVISLLAAILIAYFGRMVVGAELLPNGQQEMVFIVLARKLFPGFIAGILLAAIIAASMSTADSQLLVASSSFTSDIYKPIFRKTASDKETLWVGRIVVIIVSIIAFFVANNGGSGAQAIMNMVENAWGLFGGAFGPVVILSLFWKRMTYKGALAGIISGALVDILWLIYLKPITNIFEILPAFIVGFIFCVVVSLIDKKPSAEVEAIFDRATDKNNDE
ncbi:MAG: sodium/proline symporter PutP [Clostridia bacterium]|nr:sodium/proline symporter PutP [Clostridia bacterium]